MVKVVAAPYALPWLLNVGCVCIRRDSSVCDGFVNDVIIITCVGRASTSVSMFWKMVRFATQLEGRVTCRWAA